MPELGNQLDELLRDGGRSLYRASLSGTCPIRNGNDGSKLGKLTTSALVMHFHSVLSVMAIICPCGEGTG